MVRVGDDAGNRLGHEFHGERVSVRLSQRSIGTCGPVSEVLDNQLLHLRDRQVAHHDDGHVVGPVPGFVEVTELCGGDRRDGLLAAPDQHALVDRALVVDRIEEVRDPARRRLVSQPVLIEDDAAFFLDIFGENRGSRRPLRQHRERKIQRLGIVKLEVQDVDGLVWTGEGVQVGAEVGAEVAQHLIELVLGEALRAVEQHVLQEVRGALSPIGILHPACVYDQVHDNGLAGRVVRPQVVGEAVRELADQHVRVDRQQRRIRIGGFVVVELTQIDRIADGLQLVGGIGFVGGLRFLCRGGLVGFFGLSGSLGSLLVDFGHFVVGLVGSPDRVGSVGCAGRRQQHGDKQGCEQPAPRGGVHRLSRLSDELSNAACAEREPQHSRRAAQDGIGVSRLRL